MNWEAISAVAEILAAIGVIFSLLYLALQTRNNTKEVARANSRCTYADHATALRTIIEHGDLCDLFVRGQASRTDLDVTECYRFDLVMGNWLQAVEQAFLDYREGNYPEDSMNSHRNNLPAFLNSPGGSSFWNERRVWFSEAFQNEVEDLRKNPGSGARFAGVKPNTDV